MWLILLILEIYTVSANKQNHCLRGAQFNSTGWDERNRARYNQKLFDLSEKSKDWTKPDHLSFAQDQEDIWLWTGKGNFFEKFAEWKSIHIEADPTNYISLVNNRPNSININAALCSESKVLQIVNEGDGAMCGYWMLKEQRNLFLSMDFKAVRINIIVMECNANYKGAVDILERNGFQCKQVIRNAVCKHKEFIPYSTEHKSILRLYNESSYQNQEW
eukprot:gene13584-28841_t